MWFGRQFGASFQKTQWLRLRHFLKSLIFLILILLSFTNLPLYVDYYMYIALQYLLAIFLTYYLRLLSSTSSVFEEVTLTVVPIVSNRHERSLMWKIFLSVLIQHRLCVSLSFPEWEKMFLSESSMKHWPVNTCL